MIYAWALWLWACVTLLWTPDVHGGWSSLVYGLALLLCLRIEAKWLPWAATAALIGAVGLTFLDDFGGFGNKNFVVEFVVACLPWVLLVGVWGLPVFIAGAVYALTADSYMAIVALLAPLGVVLWTLRRRTFWLAFIVLGAVFAALVALHMGSTMSSLMARAELGLNTLIGWWDRPWGWGIGSFDYVFPFYQERHAEFLTERTILIPLTKFAGNPHNEILWILFELGPVGLVLAGLFVRSLMKLRDSYDRAAWWCLGLIFAMSLVEFPLHNPHTALLAALSVGLLLRRSSSGSGFSH